MTDAICKHGNAISLKPSYNFVRCAKCDAESDALKEKLAPAPEPAPPLDEIAEIEKRHSARERMNGMAACAPCLEPQIHQDRDTLLRILRSRTFGVDKEALAKWFRSRISPPFATPETLAQEGFLERFNARADKRANEDAQALIDSGLLVEVSRGVG